jgi:hypothetical protein
MRVTRCPHQGLTMLLALTPTDQVGCRAEKAGQSPHPAANGH